MKEKFNWFERTFLKIFSRILSTFFCKNRVLFISFSGKQYSCNPRTISEYLHKVSPKTKQVWLFDNPKEMKKIVPKYIKCVKRNMRNNFYYMSTSKVWVDNDYLIYHYNLAKLVKTKKHMYIETWHGDKGLKKCFYDVPTFKREYPFSVEIPGYCDYFITCSTFAENVVRRMMNYKGEFLKTGYPRNDCLVYRDEERIKRSKKILGIEEDTCILLYAPTFKGVIKNKIEEHLDMDEIIKILSENTGKKWACVYRAHHILAGRDKPKAKRFYDARDTFGDMADILCATDMLITDYSSCAGDFILTGKPVVLYINDYEEYSTGDRGLQFDIEKTPFMFAKNNEELINIVKNLTPEKSKQNCEDLKNFYGNYEDGNATEQVVDIILEKLNAKRRK